MEYIAYDKMVDIIRFLCEKSDNGKLCLAVDGCGGSGKSTFAARIEQLDERIKLVHVDDLYLPSTERKYRADNGMINVGGNYDLDRLYDQIMLPYLRGECARFQKYNWSTDQLEEWDEVVPEQMLVIEGVYSLHEKLRNNYHLRIWIDCPRDERLRRGIERDGEELRDFWINEWMPLEDEYLKTSPWLCADYVVDGLKELL